MDLADSRRGFQFLAEVRLREAEVLLRNDCYSGAYYFAGFSLECAFKAAISRFIKPQMFPNKKFTDGCYQHDLAKLSKVAELDEDLADLLKADPAFKKMWEAVKVWHNERRYSAHVTKVQAEEILNAANGVMNWLRKNW